MTYLLLVAHFVGDFLCQTDWMAVNKSKRLDALATHVAAYCAVLAGFVGAYDMHQLAVPWLVFVLVNGVLHFVTDAVTSRITSRLWFLGLTPSPDLQPHADGLYKLQGNRHWFFVVIGADQLIHAVTLIATAEWLL